MEDNILRFVNLKWCRATKFKYGLWAQNGLEWTFNTDDMTMSWKTTYKMDIERPQIDCKRAKRWKLLSSPYVTQLNNSEIQNPPSNNSRSDNDAHRMKMSSFSNRRPFI